MRKTYQSGSYAMDDPRYRGWTKRKMVAYALGDALHHAGVSAMSAAARQGDDVHLPKEIHVEIFDEDDYHIHVNLHLEMEAEDGSGDKLVSSGDTTSETVAR